MRPNRSGNELHGVARTPREKYREGPDSRFRVH